MDYKFKVGDKVVVKGDLTDCTERVDGWTGTVLFVEEHNEYGVTYYVNFNPPDAMPFGLYINERNMTHA